MSQIAPISASAGDAAPADPAASSAPPAAQPPAPAPAQPQPESNQRLLIQESGELGVFVYTIVDRTSGAVLVQIPHEEMADMSKRQDYAAGQVIRTTA